MRRIGYLLFTIVCIFFFPLVAHAECDYQRMSELNKIAGNVKFSYSYEIIKDENGNDFSANTFIDISNLTDDIYVMDDWGKVYENDVSVPYNFLADLKFKFFSKDSNCYDTKLLTKYVEVPKINSYYFTDSCHENPEFKYCKIWLDSNLIDYDDFLLELSNYKNKKSDIQNIDAKKTEDNFFANNVINIVTVSIVCFSLLVIFIVILKKRRELK